MRKIKISEMNFYLLGNLLLLSCGMGMKLLCLINWFNELCVCGIVILFLINSLESEFINIKPGLILNKWSSFSKDETFPIQASPSKPSNLII